MSGASVRPSPWTGMGLIVRRELQQFFSTWSGYVIMAAMLLIAGLFYNVFAVGSAARYSNDVLGDTFYFISGTAMAAGLFFSMRLVAEERTAGTFPLLASSQLSDGQIVFAKFVSATLFLCIYLALTLPMPLLVFVNGKVAVSHIAAGYLGCLLVGATAISIGLLGSSLVDSQLVALIVGAVILVVLLLLWLTARVVDGWLGDLLSYFAIHDKHFRPFMEGTVSVAHLVFYASAIGLFLMLSRNALEARRWRS